MPSQEDYLDNLLKDLNEKTADEKSNEKKDENDVESDISDIEALLKAVEEADKPADPESRQDSGETPDIEEVQSMSQEEIERLLAAGSEDAKKADPIEAENTSEAEDIMNLLNESDDADLQEIHALLQKADNNEAVDDSPDKQESLQQETEEGQEGTALDRKKEREAQRQAKRAAKEAKKAEKKAARERKKTRKLKTLETDSADAGVEEAEMSSPADFPEGMSDVAELFEAADAASAMELPENGEPDRGEPDAGELFDISGLEELGADMQPKTKKGIFAKIFDMLTEEEDGEESQEIKLSEENKDILKEMDKENTGKKRKKSRKGGKAGSEEGGEAEEGVESKKVKKAKKEKKPKKEKEPKVNEVQEPQKKLSSRRVLLISLVCLSLGLSIIIIASVTGDFMSKQEGRQAYYDGDYQSCYQNLFGKELNESEKVMYCKSESILRIRLWLKEYELLAREGTETEALDSLIQSVHDYPTLYDYSVQWNAANEVSQGYAEILYNLSEKYHLTEEQAKEIGNITDDVEYTMVVSAIAQGTSYDEWMRRQNSGTVQGSAGQEPQQLSDLLPEENELSEEKFVDNNLQ